MWSLILMAMPVYVFKSGLPQPADLALAMFLGVAGLTGYSRLGSTASTTVVRLFAYLGVASGINVFWAVFEQDTSFLRSTLFVLFNSIVFVGFLAFAQQDRKTVVRRTAITMSIALLACGALAILRPDLTEGPRLTLLFNNPNQLAYFCLAANTIVLLTNATLPGQLPKALVVGSTLAAGLVIYLTYSRSALGGFLLLCCIPFIRRPGLALLAAVPLMVAGMLLDNPFASDEYWQQRVDTAAGQDLDELFEERGVDRLIENPEYLLVGAGEGGHERFHTFGLELHSSLAGILFYYGILGLALFVRFLVPTLRGMPVGMAAYLAPALVYGFFHAGLRSRIFWLLLGIATVCASLPTMRKPSRKRPRRLARQRSSHSVRAIGAAS